MAQLPNNGMKWKALWGRAWVRWILGYVLVLACGVGLVYYWRVAYGFSALGPGAATAVAVSYTHLSTAPSGAPPAGPGPPRLGRRPAP